MKKQLLSLGLASLLVCSCGNKTATELTLSGLNPQSFQTEINGESVSLYTLKNQAGMEVCITNFGARIVSIMVPDKNGTMKDVVLGFDNIQDYINVPSDFGAAIGRYANRIKDGVIVIDGDTIQLPQNNFGHSLHGGPQGWQYKVFKPTQLNDKAVKMTLLSPDGDANYPGNVTATVTYTLTDDNAIDIKYEATTDKKTIINMTNHSYFNLSGDASKPITNDILYINANEFTPVDDTFMTTGEILPVEDTPMNFNTPKKVGEEIDNFDFAQLKNGNGYDHNWVLNTNLDVNKLAAKVTSPESGISVEVYTNEPGIQVYTGNFLDGTVKGKNGITYNQRTGICLEVQHYPDSPNKPEWPSVILEPGQTYNSRCIYKFTK
ncbi:aldose epimerase family protein [Bacteroides sp. 519]|uniref:aldose epimerase family protein n=1 Tax=Bacteroides sp. 519 TaxID=2302937 RepID=UPI0013CF4B19|nr:aldose epimerase family protein [Bacteroides sp. 519]NDV60453.1 galactose mutarotase [Bacteroides sp. 519]